MQRKWNPGDTVTVATVNMGRPVWSKEQETAKSWAGEIVGPSLVGPGWWNVRRVGARGRRGTVYAVPYGEIKQRKC
jgi:hypothetical protein